MMVGGGRSTTSAQEEDTGEAVSTKNTQPTTRRKIGTPSSVLKPSVTTGVTTGTDAVKAVTEEVQGLGTDFKDDYAGLQKILKRGAAAGKGGDIEEGDEDQDQGFLSAEYYYDENQPDRQSNIFDLAGNALFDSVMIYVLADVREFVRKHRHDAQADPELVAKFLEMPILDRDLLKIIHQKEGVAQALKKANFGDYQLYMSGMEMYGQEITDDLQIRESTSNQRPSAMCLHAGMAGQQRELVVFDDANSKKELVYSITVDRARRMLRVVFRGSHTVRDWMTDADMTLQNTENPLANSSSPVTIPQRKQIGFHSGFYAYLFGKKDGSSTNKYDQILAHLRSLLQDYPHFGILVTGHSLGASLATMCAFQLACEPDLLTETEPVICISFASPRCGNINFARAFQELELQRKIVCLRVANNGDLIPHMPDRLNLGTFYLQRRIFRHVGIELRLYDPKIVCYRNRTHRFWYPCIHRSRIRQLLFDAIRSIGHTLYQAFTLVFCCLCGVDYMKLHSCKEYMKRFYRSEAQLTHVHIKEVFDIYPKDVSQASPLGDSTHIPTQAIPDTTTY